MNDTPTIPRKPCEVDEFVDRIFKEGQSPSEIKKRLRNTLEQSLHGGPVPLRPYRERLQDFEEEEEDLWDNVPV